MLHCGARQNLSSNTRAHWPCNTACLQDEHGDMLLVDAAEGYEHLWRKVWCGVIAGCPTPFQQQAMTLSGGTCSDIVDLVRCLGKVMSQTSPFQGSSASGYSFGALAVSGRAFKADDQQRTCSCGNRCCACCCLHCPLQALVSMQLLEERFPQYNHYMHADDDSYVRLDLIMQLLVGHAVTLRGMQQLPGLPVT